MDMGTNHDENNISFWFNNADGMITNRSVFILSGLLLRHDVFIVQETNATERHVLFDDFTAAGMEGRSLTLVDNACFKRGMLLVWNPKTVSCMPLELEVTKHFEIAGFRVESALDSLTVITGYRSPPV